MWRRILSAMASIVVFCTTYALILPAITLEAQPSPEATEAIVQTQPTEETVAPETVLAEPEVPPAQVTPGGGTVSADAPEVEESTTASTEPTTEPTAEPTQAPTEAPTEPPMAEPEEIVDEELTQSGVSDEPVSGDPAAVDLAGDGEQTDASTTTPLDVTDYITGATLQYQVNGGEWKNVVDAENIPGNAVFQLDVTYGNVPIETLKNAGYQMTYKLPDLLRDAVASGDLTDSNNKPVGTIEASGNLVTLKFDEKWIADLTQPSKSEQDNPQEGETTQKQQVLNGTFYVQATANLSNIPEGGSTTIKIGDVNININFEGDVLAKRADITLTKSEPKLEQTGDGDYLKYTLTVKAGQDECLGVYVEDEITAGSDKIENYCDFDPTDSVKVSADGKSFTWTIGNMAANETRTLTYRVKLVDNFLGGKISTEQIVTNKAQAFTSKGNESYPHGEVSSHYTALGKATVSKIPKYDSTTNTIRYTIWVQADTNNTYILDHVYIKDALDGTIDGNSVTDEKIREHLHYVEDSFKLYEGGTEKQDGAEGLTKIETAVKPTFGEEEPPHRTSFIYDVGELKPGECRTLVYTIQIDPGVYAAGGNEDIAIKNRAAIFDKEECSGNWFEIYQKTVTISHKAWSRKMVGNPIEEKQMITMSAGDAQYCYNGDTLVSSTASDNFFTVPAGSYRYQIIANEAGDWDLSSAVMTDALHGNYLQYVGYVQVSAYKIDEVSTSPAGTNFGTDDEAMKAVVYKGKLERTVWVKIDKATSFKFSPKDLGMDGKYAYVLTYYAKVIKHGATNVVVANDFILSGTVGYGDVEYKLAGITARGEVTVSSSSYFAAQKRFWYYDRATEEDGKGTLYWILQIDGDPIRKDIQIKDAISSTNHGDLKTVGIYKSSTELTADMTVANLKDMTDMSSSVTAKEEDGSLVYTIKEDLTMNQTEGNQEHLYIIVSSVPKVLPTSSWDHKTYSNGLYTKSEGQMDWTPDSEVSQSIFGGGELTKVLGEVFTYVPGEDTSQQGEKTTIEAGGDRKDFPMQWDYLTEGGIYVSWHIRVNQGGTLNGTYRVLETIPDGMECVYVLKCSADGTGTSSSFVEIGGATADGWTKIDRTYKYGDRYPNALYYVKEQQVMWDIELQNGTPAKNYTEFQIVCKVTDPEVLQGGIEKTFTNTVSMTNEDSVQIGVDSDAVTIQSKSLAKDGTYDPKTNGGVYPFKITVNDLGTDLVPGSDTIKLIDELSDTLILDPTSIQVVNTKTKEKVFCTPSVDGQTLKIELPDNQPLTITYNATINAAPGQKISISNKAYWEGYATSGGSSVEKSDFSYAGGTVDTGVTPTLTIIKLDQNNATLKLPGAEFKLEEVDNELNPISGGKALNGTTGEDGELTFGTGSDVLQFNTIYRLTETKAPEGYVLDNKPHYFAICDGKETDIPKTEVVCYYVSPNYVYPAYNHKGEAEVKKVFQNAGGEELGKIDGTYKFGIFKGENGNVGEKPVQIVPITFKSGEVNSGTAKFTNLELGETYTIYELDDKGNRIEAGTSAVVSGMPFVVSYDKAEITVTAGSVPTVTVTNRMNYAELPATGGPGPGALYLSGLALIFAALVLLKKRKTA